MNEILSSSFVFDKNNTRFSILNIYSDDDDIDDINTYYNQYNYSLQKQELTNIESNIKKDEVIKNPKDPKVLAHLESLAYGLRSWSESKNIAANWANGLVGMKTPSTRDKVVFVYKNPHVLFDVSKYWITLDKHQPEETERWDYQNRFPFDNGEQIIFVKNPIIKAISFKKGIWFVLIED